LSFVNNQEGSLHFAPYCLSILFVCSLFFMPNKPLLAPKTLLFRGCFALFCHVFHVSKRLYLYHCGVFLCFSFRILQHFALHLAPFYLAFSIKTQGILHQNALRLAPKCTAFSTKMHCVLLQIAQKLVQMPFLLNKNSFCLHLQLPPFCIKTNLRENRFFAARLAIGGEKGLFLC